MDLNNISPYIRIAWDSKLIIAEPIYTRVIFDYEIIYIQDGSATITFEDRVYNAAPGDIFFVRPKMPHSIFPHPITGLHQPHIHFDLFYQDNSHDVLVSFFPIESMSDEEKQLFRDDICDSPPFDLPDKLTVSNIGHFEELIYDVINEYELKAPFYELALKAKFLRLLAYILQEHKRNTAPHPHHDQKIIEKVRNYIRRNVRTQITLDELAAKFNISKYHLSRLFKNAYGVTPIHYHHMVRIESIKKVILNTNSSLTTIAEQFGFESVNVFSRAFRKAEGIPPSHLRARRIGDN